MPYSKEATKFKRKRSFYGDGWWELTCVVCGDKFDSNQSYGKYCSQRCANDAAIAKRKAIVNERRKAASQCAICGQPIQQDDFSKIRRYCSNACKQKAYRERKGKEQDEKPRSSHVGQP